MLKVDLLSKISAFILILAIPLLSAVDTHAQVLVAQDDDYGIPYGQDLVIEAFGVLDNDTLDGGAAGDNGVTSELVVAPAFGALTLSPDGSFSYSPYANFPGIDTFIYQAVSGGVSSQATVTLTACTGGPDVFICWNESLYLAKLSELGFSSFQESFENDAVWGASREPATQPAVESQGIIWTSNHSNLPAGNEITTGGGPSKTGIWGIYDPDHGYATGTATECDVDTPSNSCLFKDGFTGTRALDQSLLYGVGGYFSGIAQPNLSIILDGTNQMALGRLFLSGHYFFGVIDTSGFSSFRIEETDGKVGQARLVFADDFILATSAPDTTPPQVTKVSTPAGELSENLSTYEAVDQIFIAFSELLEDPVLDNNPHDVTNPNNYLLFADGNDGFSTIDCTSGIDQGDLPVSVDSVSYTAGPEPTAALLINGGLSLPSGSYRLLVCGTTSIRDWSGNVLDGDGNGVGGDDFIRNFTVTAVNTISIGIGGNQTSLLISGNTPDRVVLSANGNGSGNYLWSITGAGSFSETGSVTEDSGSSITYFAPAVISGDSQEVIVTLSDIGLSNMSDSVAITIFNPVLIPNSPAQSEIPVVSSGQDSESYTVQGGDKTAYTWTVFDESGTLIDESSGESYVFSAPTTGAFAGVYTIGVHDNLGFSDSFQLKVPFVVKPASLSFTETTLDNTPNPQHFTVTGADGDYIWEILASNTDAEEVPTPSDFGTWNKASPVINDNTNTFTPADVNDVTAFFIRVTALNDPDLLPANSLDQTIAGPFTLIPMDIFTVTVTALNGVAIPDASVTVDYAGVNAQLTDTAGLSYFLLPDAGGTFAYTVTAAGFIAQKTSSAGKRISVALESIDTVITGRVEDKNGISLQGAIVAAYQPNDITRAFEAFSAFDGTFSINMPAGAPQNGYSVAASSAGYVPAIKTDQSIGLVDFTGSDGLQAKTTITSVSATLVGNEVKIELTADPAFSSANEADLSIVDGFGSLSPLVFSGGVVSTIYSIAEDFRILMKADTSEDNNPSSGYHTAHTFQYLVNDAATAGLMQNVDIFGADHELTANSQTARVLIPLAGFEKSATLVIKQLPKNKDIIWTSGSPDYVYELTAFDNGTGMPLSPSDVRQLQVTLPIDLRIVKPNDLENGTYVIFSAPNMSILESGTGVPLQASQIVSTDYVGDGTFGSVSFLISHLSVFSIGTAATETLPDTGDADGTTGGGGGGGGGGCFISTLAEEFIP